MLKDFPVIIIKPSKYDDDGYVVHHMRGVLPSNTLYALHSLIREAAHTSKKSISVELIDETVQLVRPDKIMRKYRHSSPPPLICLAGVQTNQFPRARDLALQFRDQGAQVIIGGFHVSGSYSMLGLSPEIKALCDRGISVFVGEAEGRIEGILHDALTQSLQTLYLPQQFPDLAQHWPIPEVDQHISKRFALPHAGTIDTSRGCVFQCSFCTVINVQGNSIRSRDPALIEAHIRQHYPQLRYYFFTDDNMARNRRWRDLFERLVQLRKEGLAIKFMMQVDTAAHKISDFAKLAEEAGCSQVFIGLESLNQKNLEAVAKKQNKVDRFEDMIASWHKHGIAVHTAYIIGFPHDTVSSVREDISTLIDKVRPDQASFFMLTPLPGSVDHRRLLEEKQWVSPDLNTYDSFHAAQLHPHLSAAQWFAIYREAWSRFYSLKNLSRILRRIHPKLYWDIFENAAWYKYSVFCEQQHPMITGFWRLKGRTQRRPEYPRENICRYGWRRLRDSVTLTFRITRLAIFLLELLRRTWFRNLVKQYRYRATRVIGSAN